MYTSGFSKITALKTGCIALISDVLSELSADNNNLEKGTLDDFPILQME